jgi:phosphate-selective porin OprO/OprP
MKPGTLIKTALLLAVGGIAPAFAGSSAPDPKVVVEEEKSLCDQLWSIPVIYDNKDNDIIQRIAFKGRYHGDYYALDSNHGDTSDWEHRRVRFGLNVQFLKHFDLNTEFNFNINEDADRFVQNLEELRLRYRPNKQFTLSLGRFKAPIGNEWRQSSNEFTFVERSLIVNQAVHGRLWGGLVETKVGSWKFGAGVYNAHEDADWNLPEWDGGALFYGGIGYDISKDQTVQLDFGYLTEDENNNATRPYEQLWSLWYSGRHGQFRFDAEGVYAVGQGSRSDIYGIILTPSFEIIPDKLGAVLRYQYADGEDSGALSLQRRYEREAPDLPTANASNYHALYAGLNYYICGHKLKLQAGAEFARADLRSGGNFESVTGLLAVRFAF